MPKKEDDRNHDEDHGRDRTSSPATRGLFESRTVLLFGEVNDKLARNVSAQLLALAHEGDEPIRVFVNSQGGHVESGDTIHDVIRFIQPTVIMIGTGWVASAGALIYVAAKAENRVCLPNTRFLLHQPMGGTRGQASDIEIETEQILQMRERLNRIFARETRQPYERVVAKTERNFWMSAREAVEFGLASRVVEHVGDL
ncbi:MAG: ATP-dependent Clp protease proteolytic subunit [Polyangiaceae bacterium]|nr:ATP-dependent Clp protease proteolytic subunit [Polyangiaceae bacterium]